MSKPLPMRSSMPPSPASSVKEGRKGWKGDFELLKSRWGTEGVIEGYAEMVATSECEFVLADDRVRMRRRCGLGQIPAHIR